MAGRADEFLDTHVAMSVAAAVACGQLVPCELRKPYDAQHLGEILNVVAAALARLAPVYVFDPASSTRRELTEGETGSLVHTAGRNGA